MCLVYVRVCGYVGGMPGYVRPWPCSLCRGAWRDVVVLVYNDI